MKSYFDVAPDMPHGQRLRRLLNVRDLSPSARGMPLERLDPQALRVMEEHILSEARNASHTSGRLFKTAERDRTGRVIEKFEGDPKAWLKPFMEHGMKIQFNREVDTREETVKLKTGQRVRIEG